MNEKELAVSNGENQSLETQGNTKGNYQMLWKMAARLCKGGDLIPIQFRDSPEKLFTALCLGDELGLAPMQAVRSIYAVNGRPSLYGDAQLGLIKAQADYAGIKEWKDDKGTWHCEIKRILKNNEIEITECIYSKEDVNNNPFSKTSKAWINNRDWMQRLRARAFACRTAYPDILSGIYNESETDEIKDEIVLEGIKPRNISENNDAFKQATQQKTKIKPEPVKQVELEPMLDENGNELSKQQLIELHDLMNDLGYSQNQANEKILQANSYEKLVKELIAECENKANGYKEDLFPVNNTANKDLYEEQAAKKKEAKK